MTSEPNFLTVVAITQNEPVFPFKKMLVAPGFFFVSFIVASMGYIFAREERHFSAVYVAVAWVFHKVFSDFSRRQAD
jgi:hypothetical protein